MKFSVEEQKAEFVGRELTALAPLRKFLYPTKGATVLFHTPTRKNINRNTGRA